MSAPCCAQQCCDVLCSNVAIVWPELANAGPTLLGCVVLDVAIVWPGLQASALSLISVASTRGMTTPVTVICVSPHTYH